MPRRDDERRVNRDKVKSRAQERFNAQGGGLSTLKLPEGADLIEVKKGKMMFDILP
jgi:hypothetical protein